MRSPALFLQSQDNLITRFAPSPTGYLHLGHLAHALYVWGVAQAYNGQVLLRIEDHDLQRCRPEYVKAIFEDLDFFGLEWDNCINNTEYDPIQSSRAATFDHYFNVLTLEKLVYGCECSRKTIAERSGGLSGELCYDGFCRNETIVDPPLYRVVTPACEVGFNDLTLGMQVQNPKHQCGDFVILDRHKQWTYNYSVTIDDYIQGVNLVIRGEDLLHATGRQILLAKQLGRETPAHFLHHPLIHEKDGKKMSKRFLSESLKEKREQGVSKETLFGQAAFAVGLIDKQMDLALSDIPDILDARRGV